MTLVVSCLLAVVTVGVVIQIGRRAGRLVGAAALGVAGALAVWAGALWLFSTGWKDIDGFIDCHGYCHGWHYVGAVLFGTPPLVVVLLLLVLLASGIHAVWRSLR